jgi:hypothetical protein
MLSQVAVAFFAVAPQQAVLQSLSIEAPSQIVLDGHYYALPAGALELHTDGHYYIAPSLVMGNCVRPNGAAQAMTGNALHWNGVRTVYLAPTTTETAPISFRYVAGNWQVTATSATGDLTCDGEVMPTGVLFTHGFE